MSDAEILAYVKGALGITGTFQDTTLKSYITEVKEYLTSAGVNSAVVNAKTSAGVVARGVADLWNYGNGDTKLSDYFMQRAKQLALTDPIEDGEDDGWV